MLWVHVNCYHHENFRTGHLLLQLHINYHGDDKQKGRHHEMTEQQLSGKGTRQKHTKPLSDEEIGNLPEKEFRLMIVKTVRDLGTRMRHRSRT